MNPLVVSSLIGAGAGLLGGVGSAAASAKQAQKQMDFQERMSNTAYQRAAKDLEAAGLNRILALGSPATTPGGAMGQVPDFGNALTQGMNAGANMATSSQTIVTQQQQANKLIAETEGISADNAKKIAQSQFWKAITPAVTKAAGSAEALLGYLTDPANWPTMKEAIQNTSSEVMGYIKQVLTEQFQGLPGRILDALDEKANEVMDNFRPDQFQWNMIPNIKRGN